MTWVWIGLLGWLMASFALVLLLLMVAHLFARDEDHLEPYPSIEEEAAQRAEQEANERAYLERLWDREDDYTPAPDMFRPRRFRGFEPPHA